MAMSVNGGRTIRWAWWCCALLLLSAAALVARIGEVSTRDGSHYLGHVRLASNLISIINVDAGRIVHLGLTNVQRLSFSDRDPSSRSVASPFAGPEASTALPKPWQHIDIGNAPVPGLALREGGVFRLRSSGRGIQERADAFHFLFKPVRGDSEIVARVLQAQLRGASAQAGIMMREDLEPDAPCVFFGVMKPGGLVQTRDVRGAGSLRFPQADMRLPCWIKFKRLGNTFTAHQSRSGEKWRLAGEVTVAMGEEISVGLAVAAGPSGRPTEVTFDQVQEAPSVRLIAFEPRINLSSGSTVVGRIQAADNAGIKVYSALRHPAIPTAKVASMLFRRMPAHLASKVAAGRAGVMLASGEFVDGEFRGILNDRVTISSVLFGLRSYDLNNEVIAVVLRAAHPARPRCRVRTVNGSILLGSQWTLGWNEVELFEPLLGPWRLPISELREIECFE